MVIVSFDFNTRYNDFNPDYLYLLKKTKILSY